MVEKEAKLCTGGEHCTGGLIMMDFIIIHDFNPAMHAVGATHKKDSLNCTSILPRRDFFASLVLVKLRVLCFMNTRKDTPAAAGQPPKICASCGKSDGHGLKQCTACYSVWYCNVTCQRNHRKAHKRKCKETAAALDRHVDAEVKEAKGATTQKIDVDAARDSNDGSGSMAKKPAASEEDPSCWICLDVEGPSGEAPAVRDCSCRGDAGFAHASCIIDYAKSESNQAVANLRHCLEIGNRIDVISVLEQYRDLWCRCPNCKQFYFGPLGISIAEAFTDMTSSLHETDFRWIVSQINLGTTYFRTHHSIDGAREIFVRVRGIISSLPIRASGPFAILAPSIRPFFAAEVTNMLANLEESCKRYGDAKEVVESYIEMIGPNDPLYDVMITKAKNFEMLAQGQKNTAYAVEVARKELQSCLDSCKGEEGERLISLQCRRDLSMALFADGQFGEAIRLRRDLVARAKRILGDDHESTIAYREGLEQMELAVLREKQVSEALGEKRVCATAKILGSDQLDLSGNMCFLVKMTKEGKYVALVEPSTPGRLLKYKVLPSNLLFDPGTHVLCRGLKSLPDGTCGVIQGYNEARSRYAVELSGGDSGEPKTVLIKAENFVVDFSPGK